MRSRALADLSLPHFTTRLMCFVSALDDPRRFFACTYATLARRRRRGTKAGQGGEGRRMGRMRGGRTEVDGREQDGQLWRSGARARGAVGVVSGRKEEWSGTRWSTVLWRPGRERETESD